jgi:hypothetical protein
LPQAQQWLARYASEFEHGALFPERDVLGIELKVRTGQAAEAKLQAARFLAEHAHHPLRERVRELVARRPR